MVGKATGSSVGSTNGVDVGTTGGVAEDTGNVVAVIVGRCTGSVANVVNETSVAFGFGDGVTAYAVQLTKNKITPYVNKSFISFIKNTSIYCARPQSGIFHSGRNVTLCPC